MPANWKTQQWPHNWKRSVVIPIPKKSSVKECSNYCTTALILHASKVMLKILHARLQLYGLLCGQLKNVYVQTECVFLTMSVKSIYAVQISYVFTIFFFFFFAY